jgi:hypothetical protein
MEHQFKPEIAKKYGLPEAIFLHNLCFWQLTNERNERNFHHGRYWTYNSCKAFTETFIYFSERQIERILKSLINQKCIVSGNYNKLRMDRTKWYSVEDRIISLYQFKSIQPNHQKREMQTPKNVNANTKKRECNLPNSEMDLTKKGNAITEKREAIPYNKPNNKTDNKHKYKERFSFLFAFPEFEESFNDFVEMRKAIKSTMTERAKELVLIKLCDLSKKDVHLSIEILNQSILNNWKGIFELKNDSEKLNNYGKSNQGTGNKNDELVEALAKW